MDPKVQKEFDTFKKQVGYWYDWHLKQANGHRYDCVHVEEFWDVVTIHLLPQLRRFLECRYVTQEEYSDFLLFLATKRQDLELEIAAVEPEKKEDPVITLIKNLDLTESQRRAVAEYCLYAK